ncbi:MAG TPA: hypothetical protein VKR99_09295 [Candidatus Eremiobacteraceae bacterium]|nr:hypothetical protein [Candidatus Eremiobacteraceae bacterium]
MALAARAHPQQADVRTSPIQPDVRRRRRRRTKLLTNARLCTLCVVPLLALLLYVALMSGLTAQTYALGVQQQLHAQLAERNTALRSRVAQLESVGRLQAVARQLHMSEPTKVAVISQPVASRPPQRRAALLERIVSMTRWLSAR